MREREKIFENTLQGIVQWLEIYGEVGGIFSKQETHTKASGDNLAGGAFLLQISHVTVRSGGGDICVRKGGQKHLYHQPNVPSKR